MEIEYIEGDLLAGPEDYKVQGTNAQGVMSSGIAKTIRAKYPEVFRAYRRTYEDQGNSLELGQCIWVEVDDGECFIINAVTQEHYGRDPNTVYVSYDAIERAVMEIDEVFAETADATDEALPRVAFPQIGAGLANGDWDVISRIIETRAIHFQPVVYIYQP